MNVIDTHVIMSMLCFCCVVAVLEVASHPDHNKQPCPSSELVLEPKIILIGQLFHKKEV